MSLVEPLSHFSFFSFTISSLPWNFCPRRRVEPLLKVPTTGTNHQPNESSTLETVGFSSQSVPFLLTCNRKGRTLIHWKQQSKEQSSAYQVLKREIVFEFSELFNIQTEPKKKKRNNNSLCLITSKFPAKNSNNEPVIRQRKSRTQRFAGRNRRYWFWRNVYSRHHQGTGINLRKK